jgi:uncharacterized membrane protein required for colicin V production
MQAQACRTKLRVAMYLNILLIVIFFACVGFTIQNGMWGNAVMLIIVVMSGLIAVNYYEPLADKLQSFDKSYTYFFDFLALWGVFALSAGVLRAIADQLSKVKVKFRKPFDQIGGVIFGAWIGWVMVCFTLMSLHTAPLARNFMQEAFQPEPDSRMFFGLAPDRLWLGFVQKSSLGALSRGSEFDPNGEFILKYAERRARFEKEPQARVR